MDGPYNFTNLDFSMATNGSKSVCCVLFNYGINRLEAVNPDIYMQIYIISALQVQQSFRQPKIDTSFFVVDFCDKFICYRN